MTTDTTASSSSQTLTGSERAGYLVSVKEALTVAPLPVRLSVVKTLQKNAVTVDTSTGAAEFDLNLLSNDCLIEIHKILEPGPTREKRVTIVVNLPSESQAPRELESTDIFGQLSPVQATMCKKLKECTKNLIKHKRVYVDKDYGIEDGDDADDLDLLPNAADDDDLDHVGEEDVDAPVTADDREEVDEDGEDDNETIDSRLQVKTVAPHLTTHGNNNTRQTRGDDESTVRFADDEETVPAVERDDDDDMTNADLITDGDMIHDDGATLPDDELGEGSTTPMMRVNFGDAATVQERFAYYQMLLADTMDFADCTGLGLIRE